MWSPSQQQQKVDVVRSNGIDFLFDLVAPGQRDIPLHIFRLAQAADSEAVTEPEMLF